MTAVTTPQPASCQRTSNRRAHRIHCVCAGGLAALGALLALFVDPWLAVLAAAGGLWLILAPEPA